MCSGARPVPSSRSDHAVPLQGEWTGTQPASGSGDLPEEATMSAWSQDGPGSWLAPLSQCLAWVLVLASPCLWLDLECRGAFAAPQPHFPICQMGVMPHCLRGLGEE